MKIRILDNRLRLRLSQADIHNLLKDNRIISTMQLSPSSNFEYSLAIDDQSKPIEVQMTDGGIHVKVSSDQASKLADPNEVGFDAQLENGHDEGLYILIEKDFQCLKPRIHEDETNLFPNPLAIDNS